MADDDDSQWIDEMGMFLAVDMVDVPPLYPIDQQLQAQQLPSHKFSWLDEEDEEEEEGEEEEEEEEEEGDDDISDDCASCAHQLSSHHSTSSSSSSISPSLSSRSNSPSSNMSPSTFKEAGSRRADLDISGEEINTGRIEIALEKNAQCQDKLKELLDWVEEEQRSTAQQLHIYRQLKQAHPLLIRDAERLLGNPFELILEYVDKGVVILEPETITSYKQSEKEQTFLTKSPKWTRKERRQLARGVRQCNQKLLFEEAMAKGLSVEQLQVESARIKQLPDAELEKNLEGIDYRQVSRHFVHGKTPVDCEIQWRNVDYPGLRKSERWSKREIQALEEGVDAGVGWSELGVQLNRPPTACLQEYQRLFVPHKSRGPWTLEENDALRRAVAVYGDSNWSRIAMLVPNRTPDQCNHHWRKNLSPAIRHGKFTPAEDALLIKARQENPSASWQTIAKSVPGRTDSQCRGRWVEFLDPAVKKDRWTEEEDATLRLAVGEIGEGRWVEVAGRVDGRTDKQCRKRWLQIKNKH